jgi:hypothetical protein
MGLHCMYTHKRKSSDIADKTNRHYLTFTQHQLGHQYPTLGFGSWHSLQ